MKEIVITKYGSPEVLQIRERETPMPNNKEVLVRNHFTGINFSEIMARMRLYPGAPKPPATLGSEACGIVESIGEEVTHFKPGDKVMLFCHIDYMCYSYYISSEVLKSLFQLMLKITPVFEVVPGNLLEY